MLTLLHTADWHLGATLQGWSREAEHRAALAQLVALAQAREVDAVIVAGDIFDSLNPSADAQRLLYETLRRLREARPLASIVLIAGNHDPAGRLEAPRALFDLAGVVCVGALARRDGEIDIKSHLVAVQDKSGAARAHILAVPYPRAADLPLAETAEGSRVVAALRTFYAEIIGAARREIGAAPLVVTGHLHIAGGLESEGAERRILVGGEHAAPADVFCGDPAYVALGHLHRPQSVGRETIRYAGSLIPMSKTEIDYQHGVSLVSLDDAGRASVEHVAFERSVAHRRIPPRGALPVGELEAAFDALALDPETADDARPFAHLTVAVEGSAVGLKAEIDALAEKYPLRVVSVTVKRALPEATPAAAVIPLAERQPEDLFREAFQAAHGAPPTERHVALFHGLASEEPA